MAAPYVTRPPKYESNDILSGARPLDLVSQPGQAFHFRGGSSGPGAPMVTGSGFNTIAHARSPQYLGGSGGGSGTFGGYRGGGGMSTTRGGGAYRPTYEGTLFGLPNGVPKFRAPNYSDGIENG